MYKWKSCPRYLLSQWFGTILDAIVPDRSRQTLCARMSLRGPKWYYDGWHRRPDYVMIFGRVWSGEWLDESLSIKATQNSGQIVRSIESNSRERVWLQGTCLLLNIPQLAAFLADKRSKYARDEQQFNIINWSKKFNVRTHTHPKIQQQASSSRQFDGCLNTVIKHVQTFTESPMNPYFTT